MQCHDLDQEASGASLECRVRLNGQVRLRWVRLSAGSEQSCLRGLAPKGGSTIVWLTELAPRPFSALEEPGMDLGTATFLGTLPLYWLLVTAKLGPDMWNLKHNFSKVLRYG